MTPIQPTSGFLYRLNPLSKVVAVIPATLVVIFTREPYTPLAVTCLAAATILMGASLTNKALLGTLLAAPLLIVLLSVAMGIWVDPSRVNQSVALIQIGDYHLYLGSLTVGLSTALRLTSLLALSAIAGLTTTGPDLIRATIQHTPLPYQVGYTALAALRFVPRFTTDLQLIRAAHRIRGVPAGPRRYLGYAIPLLTGAIRHAERVALAMDSRAFGAHPTRTERSVYPFHQADRWFVAAFLTATLAIVTTTTTMGLLQLAWW